MNLRELTWPVRMYWDLPASSSDAGLCLDVCKEIVEIKILFLSLRANLSSAGHPFADILDSLRGGNIGLSLTVPGSDLASSLAVRQKTPALKALLAGASSLYEVRSLIGKDGKELPAFGISFELGPENVLELPSVVSSCLEKGVCDLVLPIKRLETGRDVFCIDGKAREEISQGLKGLDRGGLRLTIHDPFLWEIFFPRTDYHEGGCQAANSMLYISPSYKVYPCPAMPVELGDLHDTSLREIILSGRKKGLRFSLLSPPKECASCERAQKCLGGCRGRAFAATGSLDRCDPACSKRP